MRLTVPVNINLDVHKQFHSDEANLGSPYIFGGTTTIKGDDNEISSYVISVGDTWGSASDFRFIPVFTKKWNHLAYGRIMLRQGKAQEAGYFSRLPYLIVEDKFKDNFKLRIKKKINPERYYSAEKKKKVTGFIIECYYEILYKNNNPVYKNKPINCSVKYERTLFDPTVSARIVEEKKPEILSINFGNPNISKNGEEKEIKIYGNPGAEFGLAINESFKEASADTAYGHSEGLSYIDKMNDVSILNRAPKKNVSRFFYEDGVYRDGMSILRGSIGRSGVTSFKQRFPSNVVKRSVCPVAVSSSIYVTLKHTSGLKVGDRIHFAGLASTSAITIIEIHPDEGGDGSIDINKIKLSAAVTIAAGKNIYFTRDRLYSIDVIPKYTTGTKLLDNTGEGISYTLEQQGPIIVTWNILGSTNWTITTNNGVDPSISRGNPYPIAVSATPGSRSKVTTKYSLLLDLHTGGHEFKTVRKPNVNQLKGGDINDFGTLANNYRESLIENAYGTIITVDNFTSTALFQHTITIGFNLNIIQGGTKNITIPLDLDKIISYGAP